jgi:hypothetical protein
MQEGQERKGKQQNEENEFTLSIPVVMAVLALSSMAMSAQDRQQNQQTHNLVQTVREAASLYSDIEEAKAAGYGMFLYVGSPNRYGMPAFYEMHVWVWKTNPNGVFADWNPNVSCEDFSGETFAYE